MEQKIPVGVLGATGMVGQQFVNFLQGHPWFELTWLGASDRSAGKKYADAAAWRLDTVMPEGIADLTVHECVPTSGEPPKLMFSATDASVATEIEQSFAKAGHTVVSNSKNHRMDPDVPLLVPEINADHLGVLERQRKERGWSGQIVTNPNCSTVTVTMGLVPLRQFGIRRLIVTTLQAISGAGYPGVPSMDIMANVIPFIGGEEPKIEVETQKILGGFDGTNFQPLSATVSAHCNRVPVIDGHIATISVEFENKPTEEQILEAFRSFVGEPQRLKLPSAPPQPVVYLPQQDRPQPRRDSMRDRGMTTTVGRLRPCPVFDYKFVALAHNTVRGAAGAAVLNAELMFAQGLL